MPSVDLKRRSLGIPAFRPARAPFKWGSEALALLGKASDPEIARRLGIDPRSVQRKRALLRIPAIQESGRPVVRNSRLLRLLRTLPSSEIRRQTGLPFETTKRLRDELGITGPPACPLRWTPAAVARLGREPDRHIARDLGITPAAVHGKRERLGIPPWVEMRRWKARELSWLGKAPDEEVARRLGRTSFAVRYRRSRMGIPVYRPQTARASS